MKSLSSKLFCGTLVAVLASGVQAAGMPPEKHAGAVSYVSGGVTRDEAEAFKAMKASYPLSIELFRNVTGKNEYTSEAQVSIVDGAGQAVLDAKADGPFMLVKLPPGHYRVQATLNGQMLSKPVQVGGSGAAQATLVFTR